MAYHVETVTSNSYRCLCCRHERTTSKWVETPEEALALIPTEFPVDGEYSGSVRTTVKDGTTGKVVAESEVDYPPVLQRGDGYKFSRWTRFVSEDVFPDQGEFQEVIIEGVNRKQDTEPMFSEDPPDDPEPLKVVTDRTWAQICDDLREKKRLVDIQKAEAEIAAAQKRLGALTSSGSP